MQTEQIIKTAEEKLIHTRRSSDLIHITDIRLYLIKVMV